MAAIQRSAACSDMKLRDFLECLLERFLEGLLGAVSDSEVGSDMWLRGLLEGLLGDSLGVISASDV